MVRSADGVMLNTVAGSAPREIYVTASDANGLFYQVFSSMLQPTSATGYEHTLGTQVFSTIPTSLLPYRGIIYWPRTLLLQPAEYLTFAVAGGSDPADRWSALNLHVDEWSL